MIDNLEILLDDGKQLDYNSIEELGLKLNRIVDDFQKPESRYGEFSYSINLPKSKNNRKYFEFADVKGQVRPLLNKEYNVKLLYNTKLILDGSIVLNGWSDDSYKCVFYSKYTQLADELKGKNLNDLTSFPTVEFKHEISIANHINRAEILSPEIEFPLCYYKTPFMLSGATDNENFMLNIKSVNYKLDEFNLAEYTNYVVSGGLTYGSKNPRYYSSFPPATYLHYIIKYMIKESGWTLVGSFFDREDIKKIIIPFNGKAEDYEGAISTGTTKYINLNKTLPNISCSDFLKSVINTFNLYFIIDNDLKTIQLETYNTYISNNNVDAIDLTKRIDKSSIVITNPLLEYKITFEEDGNNNQVGGFGRIFDYAKVIAGESNPTNCIHTSNFTRTRILLPKINTAYNQNAFEKLHNKTSGLKNIEIKFSAVNYSPLCIVNERSIHDGTSTNAKYSRGFTVSVPLLSEQTINDNKGNHFADDSLTNYAVGNAISNMSYDTGIKMLYYYGQYAYDVGFTGSTKIPLKDFAWVGIATGGTQTVPTFKRVHIPIASPFQLISTPRKNELVNRLSQFTNEDKTNEVGAEAQGLLQTFFNVGTSGGTHTITNFSLTFSDNDKMFGENLYSYFHKQKDETIKNGYQLEADMYCDSNIWNRLQINTPILYDDEYYQLVSIKNYSPFNRTARITMLKKV